MLVPWDLDPLLPTYSVGNFLAISRTSFFQDMVTNPLMLLIRVLEPVRGA